MPRGSTPEERRARNLQSEKWDRENTRQVKFKFNLRTDSDILDMLDAQDNIQGYVKSLIRADIAARGIPAGTAKENDPESF